MFLDLIVNYLCISESCCGFFLKFGARLLCKSDTLSEGAAVSQFIFFIKSLEIYVFLEFINAQAVYAV